MRRGVEGESNTLKISYDKKKESFSKKKSIYSQKTGWCCLTARRTWFDPVPTLLIDWRCESVNGWRDF